MENITPEPVHTPLFCRACSAKVVAEDTFCTNCGYPLHGTDQEQRNFISLRDAKIIDFSDATRKIRRASIALYVIGALTALGGLAFYAIAVDPTVKNTLLITNLVLAAIYVGLGFWCTSKPMAAIISGLSLYVLTFILNAISNPLTIVSSIIFKIIIIGLFIAGIKSAIEAEKLKKELNAE
jgi:hypothetical protein